MSDWFRGVVARAAEVGGVSLLGAAHATLSTRTRGPYCVRPCSCDGQEPECSGAHGCAGAACWGRHPCRTQAAGERYPTHLDGAETYAESACHEEWLYSAASLITTLRVDRNCLTRQRESQRRPRAVHAPIRLARPLSDIHASIRLAASTKSSGGGQHKPTLRRRLVGPASFRQLNKTGTFFTVAAPGTDGIRSARLRGQGPCAVPEGRRSHQPPQATTPPLLNNRELTD